jgi:hypothetical protein
VKTQRLIRKIAGRLLFGMERRREVPGGHPASYEKATPKRPSEKAMTG